MQYSDHQESFLAVISTWVLVNGIRGSQIIMHIRGSSLYMVLNCFNLLNLKETTSVDLVLVEADHGMLKSSFLRTPCIGITVFVSLPGQYITTRAVQKMEIAFHKGFRHLSLFWLGIKPENLKILQKKILEKSLFWVDFLVIVIFQTKIEAFCSKNVGEIDTIVLSSLA